MPCVTHRSLSDRAFYMTSDGTVGRTISADFHQASEWHRAAFDSLFQVLYNHSTWMVRSILPPTIFPPQSSHGAVHRSPRQIWRDRRHGGRPNKGQETCALVSTERFVTASHCTAIVLQTLIRSLDDCPPGSRGTVRRHERLNEGLPCLCRG